MRESSNILIRNVVKEELPKLLEIGKITFTESFGHLNTKANFDQYLADNFNLEKITEEFNNLESHFYFACIQDEIVGYLKLNHGKAQTEDSLDSSLEIERIYVLSKYQGRGIGQLFFEKALEIGRDQGFRFIWLGVWDQNKAAIRFYERNGFEKFATHPFKLGDDDQTDILMKLEL